MCENPRMLVLSLFSWLCPPCQIARRLRSHTLFMILCHPGSSSSGANDSVSDCATPCPRTRGARGGALGTGSLGFPTPGAAPLLACSSPLLPWSSPLSLVLPTGQTQLESSSKKACKRSFSGLSTPLSTCAHVHTQAHTHTLQSSAGKGGRGSESHRQMT